MKLLGQRGTMSRVVSDCTQMCNQHMYMFCLYLPPAMVTGWPVLPTVPAPRYYQRPSCTRCRPLPTAQNPLPDMHPPRRLWRLLRRYRIGDRLSVPQSRAGAEQLKGKESSRSPLAPVAVSGRCPRHAYYHYEYHVRGQTETP
jgi:hypothetical protein